MDTKKSVKRKKKKKKYRLFWFFAKVQLVLLSLGIIGIIVLYASGYGGKLEAIRADAKAKIAGIDENTFKASQTSLVYDGDGNQISSLKGEKDVYYLEIDEIPYYVKTAFISTEDKKFYSHNGIDLKGILRAAKAIITDKRISQGGSTITQQLSRNIFLNYEKTWQRKVEEMFISLELEKIYSKSDILEFYINNIYFANGYYGIQAASKGYFNCEVKDLSLSQIAFLCAIPNNPTTYDPVVNMDNTLKRRNLVLKAMHEDGKITRDEYVEAVAEAIVLERPDSKTKNNYVETYVFYAATRKLMEASGFEFQYDFENEEEEELYNEAYSDLYQECQKSLYTRGYRIYTSIDLDLQEQLQNAVDTNLADFTEVNEEGVYTLQASGVCIDNQTGYVKAIVGGREQELSGYTLNRAYQSYRQPGSAIKPLIVYAPILETGNYNPSTIVTDEKIEDGPKNSGDYYEGNITLRYAVAKSKNTIAWKLFKELTPKTGLSYIKKMNFAKIEEGDYVLSSALGGFTTGTSALEMASGFATLANDGKFREPTCIVSIKDSQGDVVVAEKQKETVIYSENTARMMTDMLKSVMEEGTGASLKIDGLTLAGKTGTTNDNKDGWFVGYSRYYTTSVWVGYDMPKKLKGLQGASYPGKIWQSFMKTAHEGLDNLEFAPYLSYDEQDELEQQDKEEEQPEQPVPEQPTEPATQSSTKPASTKPASTKPASTKPAATKPTTTKPASKPDTEPATEPATKPPAEQPTEPATKAPSESTTEPATKPVTEPATESSRMEVSG